MDGPGAKSAALDLSAKIGQRPSGGRDRYVRLLTLDLYLGKPGRGDAVEGRFQAAVAEADRGIAGIVYHGLTR